MKALLVYPTHDNCEEVLQPYLSEGVHAACYPPRTSDAYSKRPQNCWNDDADRAEEMGLPVVKSVCPACPHRKICLVNGYLAQLADVEGADVLIATHKRAEYTGLEEIARGRNYLSIHEDVVPLLRPQTEINKGDVLLARHLIQDYILNDPASLDWFGGATIVDDEGNRYENEELAIRKERQYQFCFLLLDLLNDLKRVLQTAEQTTPWSPPATSNCPAGIERTLYFGTRRARIHFKNQPWRFLLAAASGKFHTAAIVVDRHFHKGGRRDNAYVSKSVIGVIDNPPPANCVTWINDATLTIERIEAILGRPVANKTPDGHLERRKKAVQIIRDITRRKTAKSVSNLIRGVMADRPQFERIGIIGHSNHMTSLRKLGPEFGQRITKLSYFGSGEERSSNDWHQQCDLIIVAGTPRVPPSAIARYLVRVGEVEAASRQPEWGVVYWQGVTEADQPLKIKTSGYQDEAWRRAQRDLVRAQLVQAIGRGRGILETGCEVLVLSNEECGLPISDAGLEPLNEASAAILNALRELAAENPNKYILGKSAVKSSAIAQAVQLKSRTVRECLRGLERRGLVQKVGERSGWRLVAQTHADAAPRPPPSANGSFAPEDGKDRAAGTAPLRSTVCFACLVSVSHCQ